MRRTAANSNGRFCCGNLCATTKKRLAIATIERLPVQQIKAHSPKHKVRAATKLAVPEAALLGARILANTGLP